MPLYYALKIHMSFAFVTENQILTCFVSQQFMNPVNIGTLNCLCCPRCIRPDSKRHFGSTFQFMARLLSINFRGSSYYKDAVFLV